MLASLVNIQMQTISNFVQGIVGKQWQANLQPAANVS